MKRFLLIALSFFVFNAVSFSQELKDILEVDRQNIQDIASSTGALVTEWYNYGEIVHYESSNWTDIRVDLFPEPDVLLDFGDFMGPVWRHSVGQVLDPKGWLFIDNHPPINEFIPYRVDSIVFPYRYYRFQDAAPDTLLVQYYDQSRMSFGTAAGASFATISYDTVAKKGVDPIHEITYLLTNADSTTEGDYMKFPVGMDLPANGKFAVTLTYFPGNPYNEGDTIDPTLHHVTTNKINDFVVFEYKDYDRLLEIGTYNHSLDATTPVQNGTSSWINEYVPGIAWNGYAYQLDIYFMLTYPENTGISRSGDIGNINVFPNPTNGLLNVSLPGSNSNIEFTLVNAMGQVVKIGTLSSTNNQLDITNLDVGVYSLRLLVDGEVHYRKVNKL